MVIGEKFNCKELLVLCGSKRLSYFQLYRCTAPTTLRSTARTSTGTNSANSHTSAILSSTTGIKWTKATLPSNKTTRHTSEGHTSEGGKNATRATMPFSKQSTSKWVCRVFIFSWATFLKKITPYKLSLLWFDVGLRTKREQRKKYRTEKFDKFSISLLKFSKCPVTGKYSLLI